MEERKLINMKKSDLKTGMRVVLRNRDDYLVMLDCSHFYTRVIDTGEDLLLSLSFGFVRLKDYSDDLKLITEEYYDIVEVYISESPGNILNRDRDWRLIWERKPEIISVKIEEALIAYNKDKIIKSLVDNQQFSNYPTDWRPCIDKATEEQVKGDWIIFC
jgi:hypothetical protein